MLQMCKKFSVNYEIHNRLVFSFIKIGSRVESYEVTDVRY
jgi:hypothetical protein